MTEKTTIGGIPVECLTGESAVIWSGWRMLGDRELVREASAKGTHINLAYKCLAYRRNISLEDAFDYFAKEVEVWIMELLEKHQVYRASHILKNVGKNPIEYIFGICTKTKNASLRDYLCEYMVGVARFDDEHINAWNIIKAIQEHDQKKTLGKGSHGSFSIEDILTTPQKIKQALCTELFFSVTAPCISAHISNSTLWEYLLANNEIDRIQDWLDAYYHIRQNDDTPNVNDDTQNYKSLVQSLDITSSMLEFIDSSYATDLAKELTKTYLSRYGVFIRKEAQDLRLTLSRIFGSGMTLKDLDKILSLPTCNLTNDNVLRSIEEELCLASLCFSKQDPEESRIRTIELYRVLSNMCNVEDYGQRYEDTVIDGVFQSISYVKINAELDDFLKDHPFMVLAVIFLYLAKRNRDKDDTETLQEIFAKKDELRISLSGVDNYRISSDILQHTLQETLKPVVQYARERNGTHDEVTAYDLLNGYRNLNVRRLFNWRYEKEQMPRFSSEHLVKRYGYSETLSYGYYLKEARPNMAIHNLMHAQGKAIDKIPSQRKYKAALYAHILALRSLEQSEIVCSCVCFIEMLGISSESLRLHVTIANYIEKQLDIRIGESLEGIMYKNESDLKSVISRLESVFESKMKNKNPVEDSGEFGEAVKTWHVIVRFAAAHNFPLPNSFLIFLAKQNYWFEFLLVCDICGYPLNQVIECAKAFEDSVLREHLLQCLKNTELARLQSPINNDNKGNKPRDAKQSVYHRSESREKTSPIMESAMTSLTYSGVRNNNLEERNLGNVPFAERIYMETDDLWITILKCHQSRDPPGALIGTSRQTLRPILTVLATCYEPSSIPAYCYSWIVISTADEKIIASYTECLDSQVWSARTVSDLFCKLVLIGYIDTLSRAFNIFMSDHCLNLFFEFLRQCTTYGNFKQSQQSLLDFKVQCLALNCNKAMDWDYSDVTYLKNRYWIAVVALRCIVIALGHGFSSTHLETKFLDTLIKCDFDKDLPVSPPDFHCFLQITKILQKTSVSFDFKAFRESDNNYDFDQEINRCINALLKEEDYIAALEIAKTANIDASKIILAQYRTEFKRSNDRIGKVQNEFWADCASTFEKYNISCEMAAEFFVEHAKKASSHRERYEILKFAFETIKNAHANKQIIDTLEMALWKSCVLAGPDNIPLFSENYVFNKLKTELLSDICELQVSCVLVDDSERAACDMLINRLLDSGRLDIALRISVIFNHQHKDLELLMLCLSLAEGEVMPNELTPQQRSLLPDSTKTKLRQQKLGGLRNRGIRRLSSSSSLASTIGTVSPSIAGESVRTKDDAFSKMHEECLSMLEKVEETLKHGNEIRQRIVLCYKLAINLDQPYQLLLRLSNPIQLLQETAQNSIENKLEVLKDITVAYKLGSDSVAEFLTDALTACITAAVDDGWEDNVYMWEYHLNTNFHVVMELCSDISVLGWHLLQATNKLLGHSHGAKRSVETLKTAIELLIKSHECFTAACNMEGIASILRKCQNLANILQTLKHWTLLVRLVTGVGRFTEMNYVFQILKENDQFEFLLGKGLDKVVGLKTALLEFLKQESPENTELFTLVALHFRLYHEIALMWECEAKNIIQVLVSTARKESEKTPSSGVKVSEVKLTRTEIVKKQLQVAMTNYTHATQYYLQDNKLNLASKCFDQTQLVSLQLSLLGTVAHSHRVVCVLNLTNDEIEEILSHVLNFPQALIVIRAYNYHVDWTTLIYNHCILNAETKYLKDFSATMKLSANLVQDCVRKYRLEKSITHNMTNCMKALILELTDVECKYVMASQLGFKDVVEVMLDDPIIGAYLKDTVWKKGYAAK